MKPITLTIAGLHSFRQKQTIDFTQVYDGGIFGIFGPTGSGKSTILDAITLALYGRVERTDKNRVGIMNQQEDKVHVTFLFELSSNQSTQRYLVERVYNRTEENRNRSSIARLIKIEQNIEEVLADKETDVNNRVEELLGLKNDDFTRAVVLPQGKFAEFLTLKASNRREMLERIFNLDQYGNKLRERVNNHRKELEGKRDQLTAQQLVLAYATEEAVNTVKEELEAANLLKKTKEQELSSLLIDFKRLEKKWETQRELIEVKKQLEVLQQREDEIKSLELKKQNGERAAIVYPTVNQYHKLEEQRAALQKTVLELTLNKKQLELEVEAVNQELERRKKEYDQSKPVLTEKKYKLQEAIELEGKIIEVKNALITMKSELGNLQPIKKELEDKSAVLKDGLRNSKESIEHINKTIEYVTVTIEERRRLEKAMQAMQQLLALNKEMEVKDGEIAKTESKIVELEIKGKQNLGNISREKEHEQKIIQELEKLNENKPISEEEWHNTEKALFEREITVNHLIMIEEEMSKLDVESTTYEAQIKSIQSEKLNLQEVKVKLERELEEKRKLLVELEYRRQDQLIVELAKELEVGKPCAVCGSLLHPAPALDGDHKDVEPALVGIIEQMNELEKKLTESKITFNGLDNNQELKEEQLDKVKFQLKEQEKEFQKQKGLLPKEMQKIPLGNLLEKLDDEKNKHQVLKNDIFKWNQLYEQLNETKQKKKELKTRLEHEQKLIDSELHMLRGYKQDALESYKELEDSKKDVLQIWEQEKGEWDFVTILHRKQEVEAFDEQREKLQRDRQVIDGEIKASETKLQEINEQLALIKVKLTELELHLINENKSLTQAESKFKEITNGEAAIPLLELVTKEIEELDQLKERTEAIYLEKKEESNRVEISLVSNKAVLDKLGTQWEETENQLSVLLQTHHFVNREEVMEYLLEPEELLQLEGVIKEYYNRRHILTEQERQYMEVLDGKQFTENEWITYQAKRDEFIEEVELIKERVQELHFSFNQTKKDYEGWRNLEKERKKVQVKLDIASELSDVLKGNAFVDYIAQEYLRNVTMIASEKLLQLTRNRYSISVDQEGEFSLIDELNGSLARPVQSLSGGETFLTSLALALALSSQIQLKGGKTLEFFFLDEGFGSLDSELLDTVMMTLEKIHAGHMTIGIISHVPELQSRINRKFIVTPSDGRGNGSRVHIV